MEHKVQLLDCTLRDGAYIVDSRFGTAAIKGIIKKLQDANVDIIECGWLKNAEHEKGTSFYHVPSDILHYVDKKNRNTTYVTMIDWDRYDLTYLPENDGEGIDAIRVVFPYGKHREGITVGKEIQEKGYKVFFQAANTLAYSNADLEDLAKCMNEAHPVCLSIVDTFGAMYEEDLERIVKVLDQELNSEIKLGFHSHNNQQLSYALTMHFEKILRKSGRDVIIDSSLCGMGRGAGNTPTELIVNYLNSRCNRDLDMNAIMDAIDMYMPYFLENYSWGYSTPYFIAGMYCCHVNNIAYLRKNHRTNSRDMRNIIESLAPADRKKYDYDLLERKYLENQSRRVDDEIAMEELKEIFENREVLLIAPGKSIIEKQEQIQEYIDEKHPLVVCVNAISELYNCDYLFLASATRYEYAKEIYENQFSQVKKILLSNIKTIPKEDEWIINFERVIKRGWKHFDNAVIACLRLLSKLSVNNIALAGFDTFEHHYNASYADKALPTINPDNKWDELNEEILDMYQDFKRTSGANMNIAFITDSYFNQ